MAQGFDEMMDLYRASVKKSPALMMEGLAVDSNRGVTSRGNSPYDKFAPPETRAKVLESRMQEIDAFANSRKIPTAAVYAAAEAAMRTGKIPDLGQFGMAGDDAVAAKQFLISSVLNIQGLEWVDYKGDPVIEADLNAEMREQKKRLRAQQRDRQKTAGGFQMDDINATADQIMSEALVDRMDKASETNDPEEARRIAYGWGGRAVQTQADAWNKGKKCPYTGCPSPRKPTTDRVQADSVQVDPSRFMIEGAQEGMRKATQVNTGEYGRPQGGRPGSSRLNKVDLKIGKTRSRREGKEQGQAGLTDYQSQKEAVSVDPSRFMAEGSTKAGGYPFADKEKHYRGHTDAQLSFAHKDALEAAKAAGTHDPHAEGWYRDDAATIAKERARRQKGVTSSVEIDASRVVSEEGGPYQSGGAPHSAPLSPARMSDGGMALDKPQSYERHDLLPKEIIAKLKEAMGDAVHNLSQHELFAIARERGLLGTEEGAAGADLQEHGDPAEKFTRAAVRLAELSQEKIKDDDSGIESEIKRYTTARSETDKILGIEAGDPRAEAWPKLSDEMRSLLNLEDHGVFRTKRGFSIPAAPTANLDEATCAGGVGGFIGGGMGGGLSMRTAQRPSYDASYNLPDDPEERVKVLKKMLDKHGLKDYLHDDEPKKSDKKDVKEDETVAQKVPTVRDPAYDTHPSRFMK